MQIDELIVSLVLDTSKFKQGQKDAAAAAQRGADDLKNAAEAGEKAQTDAASAIVAGLNRLAAAMEKGGEAGEKHAKRQAEGNKKVAASFEGAIRTGLTFLAVLAGARTVEQFTRQITALDAALGRTAYGMGQTPQALSAIGKAVQRAGGDFSGAVGGLRALSDAYQDFRTTGSSALIEPMTRLQALSGKAVSFGKDTLANFESIADALQALDAKGEHALADRLGRQILGSDDLTNLARRGGAAVRAEIAESGKHGGLVDPKDVKAAQDLQNAYEGLSQSVVGLGTKLETALSPYLTKLLRQLDELIGKHGKEWVDEFSAFLEKHRPDIENFGKTVGDIATSAGAIATAFSKQSPMVVALEAFAGLMTLRLLNPLTAVLAALRAFSAFPVTGLLARLLGTPAGLLGATIVGGVGASVAMNAPRVDEYGREQGNWGTDPEHPFGFKEGNEMLKRRKAHTPHSAIRRLYDWGKGKLGLGGGEQPHDGAHLGQRRARSQAPDASLPQGPVPGASGAGLKNAYWRGSLDGKGEGGHLSPRELFDYLKSRGATDNEATMLTGAASSESSFNPNANHDPAYPGGPPTGHGLWGHKHSRIDMRGMSWQQQADAALLETRNKRYAGRIAAARTPEELADAEMYYEGPAGFKPGNPRAGDNYMGRLNSIRRFSAMAGRPVPVGASAASSEKAITDAEVFAARQRIAVGGRDPKDIALRDRYLREQNAPRAAPHPDDDRASRSRAGDVPAIYGWHLSPVQYTHGGGRNPLSDLHREGWLGGQPVKVDVTPASAKRIGDMTIGQAAHRFLHALHHSQQVLKHAAAVKHLPSMRHGHPGAMAYHRSVMDGMRMAAYHHNPVTNHIDRSSTSETKIGSLTVHTQAKDGQEVADALDGIYQRAAAAGRRNYGQA